MLLVRMWCCRSKVPLLYHLAGVYSTHPIGPSLDAVGGGHPQYGASASVVARALNKRRESITDICLTASSRRAFE